MKLLRRLRRRLPSRRIATDVAVRLTGATADPVRRHTVETAVDASTELAQRTIRRILPDYESQLTPERIEKKYDELAGHYIQVNIEDDQRPGVYWIDGQLRHTTRAVFERHMMDEHADILSRHSFTSLLEVGAGELTTLTRIADRIGRDRVYHAIDLSFPRIHHGIHYFSERDLPIHAARANAVALPYPDDSFDVVFSSHCLEQIPLHFERAIDEMIRVARSAVVLFEPSFELGSPLQKFRMIAQGYARGIQDYLASLSDVAVSEPRLLDNASPYNRTALYQIRLRQNRHCSTHFTAPPRFACPTCHTALGRSDTALRCHRCHTAHPVIDGIPDLGEDAAYSISPTNLRQSSNASPAPRRPRAAR